MNALRRLVTAVMPVAVVGLAACSSSSTPFDPASLSQSTDAIITPMDSSAIQHSMEVLGSKMTAGAAAMNAVQLAALPRAAVTGGFAAWTQRQLRVLQAAQSQPVAAPQAVIPTPALGVTFAYNADLGSYQADANAQGAPANGVRFILYAVNPLTQTVVTPLNEIGYADILDESSGNTNQIELQAYATDNTTPLIDYTASATATPTSGTASASGYLSDGTHEVDFDLTQTFSAAGLSVNYSLSAANSDVSVVFQASITLAGVASSTISVKANGNTDVITATGTEGGAITGQITHNGTVVVVVGGTSDAPTFTDASGNPITGAQAAALRRVALFIGGVLLHVDGLLAPAHALFLLPF
jgi:hypothetical protein